MPLKQLFSRTEIREGEMGPLYPHVRAVMVDVQAYARSHGGQIDLLSVTNEGDVSIRLTGACDGCPMSDLTLKHGIEEQLRALVPGVRRVYESKN